ncbi:hypothetical protein ACJ41O_014265 [Fusarium nematophilum]
MATTIVTISIDPTWVSNFNSQGTYSLCMARAVKDPSGKEVMNVIAQTITQFEPNVQFEWVDEFTINATTTAFNDGVLIQGEADGSVINYGQTYNIESWTKTQTYEDQDEVPNDSIGFQNEIVCSAILSMKANGADAPIFITPNQLPPGFITLAPRSKAMFWFQQGAKAGTMIHTIHNGFTVQTRPGSNHLRFTADGQWQNGPTDDS